MNLTNKKYKSQEVINLKIGDYIKLIAVFIVGIGTVFLTYFGKMDPQASTALLGGLLGYVFGNAHAVIEKK